MIKLILLAFVIIFIKNMIFNTKSDVALFFKLLFVIIILRFIFR